MMALQCSLSGAGFRNGDQSRRVVFIGLPLKALQTAHCNNSTTRLLSNSYSKWSVDCPSCSSCSTRKFIIEEGSVAVPAGGSLSFDITDAKVITFLLV